MPCAICRRYGHNRRSCGREPIKRGTAAYEAYRREARRGFVAHQLEAGLCVHCREPRSVKNRRLCERHRLEAIEWHRDAAAARR